MEQALTGRELDIAIASAMDRRLSTTFYANATVTSWWVSDGQYYEPVPLFHKDANQQFAVLSERRWTCRIEINDSDPEHIEWVVWVETDTKHPDQHGRMTNEYDSRSALDWQEAGARALLSALQADRS